MIANLFLHNRPDTQGVEGKSAREDSFVMTDLPAIIVSGTPGTGKTRFSRLLARRLGIDSINLTEFAKQRRLVKTYDRARRTYVIDEKKLRVGLRRHLTSSKTKLVIDTHYCGSYVPTRLVDIVFVLRCSPEILRKRLAIRGYDKLKIRENIEAEVLDVCLSEAIAAHGLQKVAEIDTTTRKVEDCVEEAMMILTGKMPKRVGAYDWIVELEREGKLDRFLKERASPWKRRSQ